MRRRARTLQEFVPVHPDVLSSMIRGWITGRMLGLIPDPSHEEGFSIRTEEGEARFPWPLVQGHGLPSSGKVSWLPALLESIPLAFALYSTEPNIIDAYDEMYLLGQPDRLGAAAGNPGADYQRPGMEIEKFIRQGDTQGMDPDVLKEAFAPSNPNVSSPEEDRKQRLLTYLQNFQNTLKKRVETGVNQSNIWTVEDGSELFVRIIDCAQEMINAITRFGTASDEEVG